MNSDFITGNGKRNSNQDVLLIESIKKEKVYLLADGMGGYKNGELAANFIVSNLYEQLKYTENYNHDSIQTAIDRVTKAFYIKNLSQESKMGATLGGVVQSKNLLHCFWIGDVKIWHLKQDKIAFESIEHNLKNELLQNKVFVETKTAKRYKHIVTRSIQNNTEKSLIDYKCIDDFENGDFILMASDGVSDVISNHHIIKIMSAKNQISEKLNILKDELEKLAKDNYSIIVIYNNSLRA